MTPLSEMVNKQQALTFSVKDKIKMANALDDLGIDYIEGGGQDLIQRMIAFLIKFKFKKFQSSCFWHD